LAKRFKRRRLFRNQPIRNKNCLWRPWFLTAQNYMSNLYRGPSTNASYQISNPLAKRFQRRRLFRNRTIRNKNCLWRPCIWTNLDKISNLYRGHSIDTFYQVSVHLAKQFQRRILFFWNQPTRNTNCLWRPCLLMDRDEMCYLYRRPSIDASF
jgi:hypothetical protein